MRTSIINTKGSGSGDEPKNEYSIEETVESRTLKPLTEQKVPYRAVWTGDRTSGKPYTTSRDKTARPAVQTAQYHSIKTRLCHDTNNTVWWGKGQKSETSASHMLACKPPVKPAKPQSKGPEGLKLCARSSLTTQATWLGIGHYIRWCHIEYHICILKRYPKTYPSMPRGLINNHNLHLEIVRASWVMNNIPILGHMYNTECTYRNAEKTRALIHERKTVGKIPA